ncbi:hypothetical protein [Flavobacterium proteolyticum]|uniref:SMODS and SLOG-associating 2TM effector domain-containing protein n=1 Tax=Flavobacterium proteolyticum TaxID=2911683 RepID=A0ABR9WTI9_9FLAO|nr:hypothetical protein [Flavobacterium proteolyticum]MBE9576971.1 hypothetical protein [Flavobacterium proteolyticum]
MKKTNFKFEDISFYVDNLVPYISNKLNFKINRLHNLNRKRFALIFFSSLLILPFSQVIMLLLSNESNGFYYFLLFIVLIFGIYINSKLIYFHNNILNLKVNRDEELLITERYGNVVDIENIKIEESNHINILNDNTQFDDKFKFWLKEVVKDLNISSKKEFVVLLLFIKESVLPLKSDKWLIENFNLIFKVEIKPQYVSHIRGTELKNINTETNFSRTQREFYVLFDNINTHFTENYRKKE